MAQQHRAWPLLALLAFTARALPLWSWDTINTFVHCANYSGPWSARALAAIAKQAPGFVVQERWTGRFAAPTNHSTERKMLAAAAQIKSVAPDTHVLMYNPVFPLVTAYDYASRILRDHPEYLLRWPNGTLWQWQPAQAGANGGSYVGDFSNAKWRAAWVGAMADVVRGNSNGDRGGDGEGDGDGGHPIDGVMIDGFRGQPGNMGVPGCPADVCAHLGAAWGRGVNQSIYELRDLLPRAAAVVGNYGTAAPDAATGKMMERAGSGAGNIALLQQWGAAGKLVEFHVQYADRGATFNASLATFMLGMSPGAYFGAGIGWGSAGGDEVCDTWLRDRPEFHRPIGPALTAATTASTPENGTLWERHFASGTRVVQEFDLKGRSVGSCIFWADNATTGDACGNGSVDVLNN